MQKHSSMRTRPLGISVLALVLFLFAGLWLIEGLILPLVGLQSTPWPIAIGAGIYFLIVGWGVWGVQRWSYLAALLMCVVLLAYQIRSAVVLEQNVVLQVVVLVVMLGYLLLPRVRKTFLAPAPDTSNS